MRRNLFTIALLVFTAASFAVAQKDGTDERNFHLNANFYGPRGYTDPAAGRNYDNRMANGFSFMPPADGEMLEFLEKHPGNFMLELYAASKVLGSSPSDIESQRRAAATFCSVIGRDHCSWNAMPEWDQSGGHWVPGGRPNYTGLNRGQAFRKFSKYYLQDSPPLGSYLQQSPEQRQFPIVAQTDYVPNTFYAYSFGADVVLLERSLDELGDTSTGIAFVRGASRQHSKPWGIDISTWRTFCNSETRFDTSGTLTSGWSPSYLRRHLYASYLGGANIVQIEPTPYYDIQGHLNPFGAAVKEFGDFALVRHTDVGRPSVAIAIMLPYQSGFDTKHGPYNQRSAVWYQDIPYSSGDYMINNLLIAAYPNHWLHGTMPCPFKSGASYSAYLKKGGDPRPCEIMPFTRWGDNLDIITDNAPAQALEQYKAIVLAGDLTLTAPLRSTLQGWVQRGGTLVVNSSQISREDWSWVGITLGSRSYGHDSSWMSSDASVEEPEFVFPQAKPTTAAVLATTREGRPLITSNTFGKGRVLFTTPFYMQASSRTKLLHISVQLLDWLNAQYALATVNGPPLEYVVNEQAGSTLVGLINNSGKLWSGSVNVKRIGALESASEFVSDQPASATDDGDTIHLTAEVPPYDLKVLAIRFAQSH